VARQEMGNEWLEPVLTEHLGRVRAPKELWYRVQTPGARQSGGSTRQLGWALATTLAIVAVAWGFHARGNGLSANQAHLTLRCAAPGQIRAWVKANTGIDIPLAAKPPATVQLVSALAVKGDLPAAEVDYRVEGHDARLLVARAGLGEGGQAGHQFQESKSGQTSWTMRGQTYTLASADPAELRVACLLCHAGGQPL